MSEKTFRRFFVYFCAFIGAGFVGLQMYQFVHLLDRWTSDFTWIIVAALVVGALFTWRSEANDKRSQ